MKTGCPLSDKKEEGGAQRAAAERSGLKTSRRPRIVGAALVPGGVTGRVAAARRNGPPAAADGPCRQRIEP